MPDIVVAGAVCSRDELDERASLIATRIVGASVVGVVAAPTIDTIAAVLGAQMAGAVAVPVNHDATDTECTHILRDCGAQVLIDDDVRELDPASRTSPPPRGTALILYTSGTTGAPKGVPISGTAISACIDALAEAWAWTPADVLVHGLPLHHVHGLVLGVFGPLRVGCALHHTGRPSPSAYAAAGGSLYFGVPTIWSRVVAEERAARALASARLLVSGSAPLRPATFEALTALTGQRPVERYGMTETLITVSTRADGPRDAGTVGTPLRGVQTRLTDERGDPVGNDGATLGGLEIRGSTVFSGYLGRPDATQESFTRDGWFRTGDVATIDADGAHRIVGRASTDLIKSGGYRIGAGEVEEALLSHPGVLEVAVVGEPDDDLGQRIVAYVVATDCSESGLLEHAAGHLSRYKLPRRVMFVDALPRNAMGKVEKARLR